MTSRLWRFMWVPVVLLACSGKTVTHGNTDPQCETSGGCSDAGPICKPGATKTADDGCNTCTCSQGGWACTERACPAPACTKGDTKPADDGCNTCVCTNGAWSCSEHLCPAPPICTNGATKPAGDGCNTCTCSGGQWQCTLLGCELMCQEGDTKQAEDCNTCTCRNNDWVCTQNACACVNGDTMQMDCNSCVCMNGSWACTTALCGKACGGWAGNTCASDEYCAYDAGGACGATDAEATCKKRPQSCTTEYAPVCGCDGKTYSNQCAAAAAGTGINTRSACPLPL